MKFTRSEFLATVCVAGASGLFAASPPRAAQGTYRERVLAKGPVGYWPFDDAAGSRAAADASGNHRPAAFHGGITAGSPGPFGDGAGAIIVNGVDGYAEVADSAAFSQSTSGTGLTVEVWMRPDTLTFTGETAEHYVHWLGKGERGAYEWGFRFYSADSPDRPNRISAYIWNPSVAQGQNEGAGAYFQDPLQAGAWIHVVATFDPGDANDPHAGVSIYKNGVFRAGPAKSRGARYASYAIEPAHGAAPVRIGTRDLGSFFKGGLDEFAIYPRVLRAAEIADNFGFLRAT
jgi:Concanavalin A-like lectin/glucanases superfamily